MADIEKILGELKQRREHDEKANPLRQGVTFAEQKPGADRGTDRLHQ